MQLCVIRIVMREYLVLEDSRIRLKLDSVGKANVGARNWRGKMD